MPQRASVSIVFCDLVGSTALLTRIGEAANDELRRDVFSVLRRPLAQLGGEEVKTQGDGMMAAFRARASDAVACAVAWMQSIDVLAQRDPALRLALRIGVASGEATFEEDDWFGTPVVEAARLCMVAAPSQILVSDAVRLVVGDESGFMFAPVGPVELKGFPEPRPAHAVEWTPAEHHAELPIPPLLDTTGTMQFAGRADELRSLTATVDGAATGARRTALVGGPAGSGKTRLVAEIVRGRHGVALAGDWTGRGPYEAPAEALRWYAAAASESSLRAVLANDAGVVLPYVPALRLRIPGVDAVTADADATIRAFAAVFTRIAADTPLVLVFDDLQAASGEGLALFLELATARRVPGLALIGCFRTDDDGHVGRALATVLDKLDMVGDVTRVDLAPLDAAAVATIAGDIAVDAEAVLAATGGNAARVVDTVRQLSVADDPQRALALALPFKGLLAFGPEDAPLFFGRDDEVGAVLGRLAHERFVAIVGTSGGGKSSLVRAGVMPALASGRLPGEWPSVAFTPGAHPVTALADAVAAASTPPRLVVVDQLEECITQCDDAAERAQFLDDLAMLAVQRDTPTRVLVTVRADLLGALAASSAPFAALLESRSLFLGPMREDALRTVIEGPAHVAGLRLESGLVDIVVGDVAGEPGALPLLSHAMLETWKRRRGTLLTIDNYREAGGARGAIAHSADVVFESLDARGQELARELFMRLTEIGEGVEDSRRRIDPSEAATIGTAEERASLVDALASARLITVDEGSVEVAHEALIRQWPRLRAWLDESRDELRSQRELRRRAEEWDRLGRPDTELLRGARLERALEVVRDSDPPVERAFVDASRELRDREAADAASRVRRLRTLLSVAVVLLLIAAATGVVAIRQRRDARAQAALAEVQRTSAEAVSTADTNLMAALPLSVEASRLQDRFETRNALLSVLQREPALLGYLQGPAGGYTRGASIAADGRAIALPTQNGVDVVVLPARTRRASLPVKGVNATAMIGDNVVAVATPDAVELWDAARAARVARVGGGAVALAAVRDGVVAGAADGTVRVIAAPSGRIVARVREVGDLAGVAANPRVVVTATTVGPKVSGLATTVVVARDPRTLAERKRFTVSDTVSDIAVSPDGTQVALGQALDLSPQVYTTDGQLQNYTGGGAATPLISPAGDTSQVAFVDDGTIATAGVTGTVATWLRASDFRQTTTRITQFGTVRDLLVPADGSAMWAVGSSLVGWSLDGHDTIGGPPSAVRASVVAMSPDGRFVAAIRTTEHESELPATDDPNGPSVGPALSVSRDSVIVDTHTLRRVGAAMPGIVVGFQADGRHVVLNGESGGVVVGAIGSGAESPLRVDGGAQRALALSDDGRLLAVQALDGSVSVVDAETGATRERRIGPAGKDTIAAAAVAPDGRAAIAYSSPPRIVVAGGTAPRTKPDAPIPSALAFARRSQLLAVGGDDGSVRLFDLTTGEATGSWLLGHTGKVMSIVYSADDGLLASTAADNTTRLFDVERRRPYGRPFGSDGQSSAQFSPDGNALFGSAADGIVRYDLDPAHWSTAACDLAGTNLSRVGWQLYLPGRTPVTTCPQYAAPS